MQSGNEGFPEMSDELLTSMCSFSSSSSSSPLACSSGRSACTAARSPQTHRGEGHR
jgi:hypothetical protein